MTYIKKANEAFRKKNYEDALNNYHEAIKKNPELESSIKLNILLTQKKINKKTSRQQKKTTPPPKTEIKIENEELVQPFFNAEFYLFVYPDIKKANIDPLKHYLEKGWIEGRNPSPIFNTNYYLKKYKDVKTAKINPLIHFAKSGNKEGRSCCPTFDKTYYLNNYNDVLKAGIDPYTHYIKNGLKEGRRPHPLFTPTNNSNLNYHHDYYNAFSTLDLPLFPQKPLYPNESESIQSHLSCSPISNLEIISNTKNKTKNRIAMYSANIGSRDNPAKWNYIPGVDFYCFTDMNFVTDGLVNFLDLDYKEIDNKRTSLYYKTSPNDYFKDYDIVIWCDQNVSIKNIDHILEKLFYFDILSFSHWGRNCLYEEAEAIISSKRESKDIVKNQLQKYKNEGFPFNYGLFETNVLAYNLNSKKVLNTFSCWRNEIIKHAKRDQLSFTYSLWKCDLECGLLELPGLNARNSSNYEYQNHD